MSTRCIWATWRREHPKCTGRESFPMHAATPCLVLAARLQSMCNPWGSASLAQMVAGACPLPGVWRWWCQASAMQLQGQAGADEGCCRASAASLMPPAPNLAP